VREGGNGGLHIVLGVIGVVMFIGIVTLGAAKIRELWTSDHPEDVDINDLF
jgi:FtsH-binding integral membrane protein